MPIYYSITDMQTSITRLYYPPSTHFGGHIIISLLVFFEDEVYMISPLIYLMGFQTSTA